jgi:uncharacterized protein (TIGR00251 family)
MTAERKFKLHDGKKGAAIAVRVTPRASRNEITEIMNDGTIKIRLTASPVEGKANEALIAYLSKLLDLNVTKLEIVAGLTGREKLITIMDMTPEEVHQKIISAMA